LVAASLLLVGLHLVEQGIEALKILFPNFPVAFQPRVGFLQRLRDQAPWTALGIAAAGDESGALEHAKVFRDGGLRHVEGLREFVDRSFPGGQTGQNGAARRIGERGESGVEAGGGVE
jgi:hypothetical protein